MEIPYLSLKRITDMHADEIQQAVREVVDSGWYLQGERIARFEREYADYCGTKHCVSCANGLDALTLMLQAYKELGRLHDGDEVIVPANTYIATILAITENNLVPVLVEPSPLTSPLTPEGGIINECCSLPFQIDDSKIEEAITEKTKAIMLVNLYGYNSYTEKIGEICKRHSLILMVDCAQSHGITLPSGAGGAWSFYPGKNLGALADAGAMTTDDDELAEVFRALANYGSSRKYVFDYLGRNSRMDEISAAVLSVKLKYLNEDNKRRQEIAELYINNIKNENILLPPREGVHHIFPILTPQRDELQAYLREQGIGTMIHYPIPPHKQECYKEWNQREYPITERIHREELSLPLNQAMTNEEVFYIIDKINNKQ